MRLHSRLIKYGFWTDPELVQELSRDGRIFYVGLWQLAEDSGCVEDNSFSFKINLFPGDPDITPEILAQHKDLLIKINKIIPYQIDGKNYLYLKNFFKHQTIKNPDPPTIPIPNWIAWLPYQSNPRTGRYSIDKEKLNVYLQSSYGLLTHDLQNSSNLNLNLNLNLNKKHMCASGETHASAEKSFDENDGAQKLTGKGMNNTPAEKPSTDGGAQLVSGKGNYTKEFEEFWSHYPRKVEKIAAFKAWKARIKEKVPIDTLITAVKNYTADCMVNKTEPRYIKHAATFLGPNEPYKDFVKAEERSNANGPNKSNTGKPSSPGFKPLE